MNCEKELSLYHFSFRKNGASEPTVLNKKYRSGFEIMALILEAIKDDAKAQYSIMKNVGINYKLLGKYLDFLTEMDFIEKSIEEGRVLYRDSVKGLEFLRQYYVLLGMLLSASTRNRQINMTYKTRHYAIAGRQKSMMTITSRLRQTP
jgi:predicted transcriptional regulator